MSQESLSPKKTTGYWKLREQNPTTGKKYYDWIKGEKPSSIISPVSPDEPPEEPPPDPNLLTPEQYEELKRKNQEKKFDDYRRSRPDLYPELKEED